MNIRSTAIRICQERGIKPADSLYEPPLTRTEFYANQLVEVVHRRWAGRYDTTEVDHTAVAEWVQQHLADPIGNPSLLMAGKTGSGKTWQAIGALKIIARHNAQLGRRLDWAVISHPELNEELRPKSDNSHEHALTPYLKAELLILDDLGSGQVTSWATDSIQRLVDHRWAGRLATIYTTNLTKDPLRTAVGDRVYSRIGDATRVAINGSDRRWEE